jgi:ArsR family transcriptional regulator, arsenate/arsenite/antimonite-responsive transcriptional repressor
VDTPTRERASQLFSALGHPTRLRIVETLVAGPMTVNQIAGVLGLSQSTTSQNLAILTRAGILMVGQQGTSRHYRLRGPRVPAILALIEDFCRAHALYGVADDSPVSTTVPVTDSETIRSS